MPHISPPPAFVALLVGVGIEQDGDRAVWAMAALALDLRVVAASERPALFAYRGLGLVFRRGVALVKRAVAAEMAPLLAIEADDPPKAIWHGAL